MYFEEQDDPTKEAVPKWYDATVSSRTEILNEEEDEDGGGGDDDEIDSSHTHIPLIYKGYEEDGATLIPISNIEVNPNPTRCPSNIMDSILQAARDASEAQGKNYAAKVTSVKTSMAMKADKYGGTRNSTDMRYSRERDRERERSRSRSRSVSRERDERNRRNYNGNNKDRDRFRGNESDTRFRK